jgi:hypothetical protein
MSEGWAKFLLSGPFGVLLFVLIVAWVGAGWTWSHGKIERFTCPIQYWLSIALYSLMGVGFIGFAVLSVI